MIDQIARHGMIDIDISCKGDLHIDDHHTAEDIGITLGQAIRQALGDKKASAVTDIPTSRSTKPSAASSSTFPAAPDSCTTSNLPAH